MKKILLFLFLPFLVFSQETNEDYRFYELTGTRVFVNKKITSYNFTTAVYSNDIKTKEKEYINFKNPVPTSVYINSDANQATIRINSKYFREDLFFEFRRIYKIDNGDGSFMYKFIGKNPCSVFYFIPENNYNQSLFIKCLDANKNGYGIDLTMSQNEQL